MTYHLGIDLGTTYTAAATHDAGRIEVVPLGDRGPSIPSVLYLRPDGNVVAGDTANRHAVTSPERIAREFKRRLGDPTPVLLGGVPTPPELLTGHLLRWVFDVVVRAKGAMPAQITLTHPANWGPFKRDLLDRAAQTADLNGVRLVTEPEAAAISYASQERVEPGAVIAVYDLGGGTFDAAVLRKEADATFTILGAPEGLERLGGIDFDAAVFAHVTQALEGVFDELDPDDEAVITAVARLRQECIQAKEALSLDSAATIPVLLPTTQTEVHITRTELEAMIRPALSETVVALERALRSANLTAAHVSHVLLVGGSSRIPVVAQMVSEQLGRPVAIDAHPKHAVALGAAIVAARAGGVSIGDALNGARSDGDALITPPFGVALPPMPRPAPGMAAAGAATAVAGAAAGAVAATAAGVAPNGNGTTGADLRAAFDDRPPPPPNGSPGGHAPGPAQPPSWSPPPPAPPGAYSSAAPAGADVDPTFDAAQREAPAPSLGYQAASRPPPPGPPPPGMSNDLPPGYMTRDQRHMVQRKERRKSHVMFVLGALILLLCIAATILLMARNRAPQTLADVEAGECFLGEDLDDLEVVDCGAAHHGEVIAIVGADGLDEEYMGQEELTTNRGSVCTLELVEYFGAAPDVALANGIELRPVVPTEEDWNDGQRDTRCVVGPAEGGTVEGSIEGEGAAAAPATPAPGG